MRLGIEARRIGYRVAYVLLVFYSLIRRPRLRGVKCVLTDGDQVLLVRHTYGPRGWDLPGGGIKRKEEPLTAARREIEEELGLEIDQWTPLGQIHATVYTRRDTLWCFHAEVHNPRITSDPVEIATTGWFPRHNLPRHLGRFTRAVVGLLER